MYYLLIINIYKNGAMPQPNRRSAAARLLASQIFVEKKREQKSMWSTFSFKKKFKARQKNYKIKVIRRRKKFNGGKKRERHEVRDTPKIEIEREEKERLVQK